jgi:hypothetical protein
MLAGLACREKRREEGAETNLRLGGNATNLDVAESEVEKSVNSSSVLVPSCSHADGIVELLAPDLARREMGDQRKLFKAQCWGESSLCQCSLGNSACQLCAGPAPAAPPLQMPASTRPGATHLDCERLIVYSTVYRSETAGKKVDSHLVRLLGVGSGQGHNGRQDNPSA